MKLFRNTALAIVLAATTLAGTAQVSKDPAQKPPGASVANAEQMAAMDKHMLAMREMHEKFMRAKTPEERNALMAEQMKLMQDGMPMMGGMGMGGKGMGMGMGGMGAKPGQSMAPADMAARHGMMEKRMDMMQSMMQMMMDRMAPTAGPAAPSK